MTEYGSLSARSVGSENEDAPQVIASASKITTFEDLKEDEVEHLMKFLTAEDVMVLGQTSVKWRDTCKPVFRKKTKEMSVAWSRDDYIPTKEEVAIVERLLANNLIPSQIITGKVAAVSEVWSRNNYFPTEAEVDFVALLASNGHIPQQILAAKAAELGGNGYTFNSSLPQLATAAALATHGYITHVGNLGLRNLDLDSVSA